MTRKSLMFLLTAILVIGAAPGAFAQTTAPTEVMFHWGAIHTASGQALAFNFELSDHFGLTAPAAVELRLEDKNGNLIYDNSMTVTPGHAVTWVIAIGPDVRTASKTIDGDTHGIIAIDTHTIQPCLKVTYP